MQKVLHEAVSSNQPLIKKNHVKLKIALKAITFI